MTSALPIEVQASTEQPLGMPVGQFLNGYWQKHPLLIRQAFPDFELPLQPDDLGGLACEENALSRLIEYNRERDHWSVHTGPLDEAIFARLPDRDWTVLVQDVDKWDMDVARLLEHFRFLPGWRIDDVMISYAEDGGGVGAHVDEYDVFLLQGLGQRRWSIDAGPNPPMDFRAGTELKLLREFTPSHSWVLEPGDMLYLPPRVPHDGVAEGACMTFSVGLRAPSNAELLLDFSEHLAERMPESDRYADPDLTPAECVGEIDEDALMRVRKSLGPVAATIDDDELVQWFGAFITCYRSAQIAAAPEQVMDVAALRQWLAAGKHLTRHPWTRMAWAQNWDACWLFVAGQCLPCPPELAERLCAQSSISAADAPADADIGVLHQLLQAGHLIADEA